jgi:hypothetical protein
MGGVLVQVDDKGVSVSAVGRKAMIVPRWTVGVARVLGVVLVPYWKRWGRR